MGRRSPPLARAGSFVHFTAFGSAIGQLEHEPAVGGLGSGPYTTCSSITLRVPEGRTTLRAYGFACNFGVDFDSVPAYLQGLRSDPSDRPNELTVQTDAQGEAPFL